MKDHRYLAYGPAYEGKMGAPVRLGDKVTDFRGDDAVVVRIEFPQTLRSTGRVYVKGEGEPGSAERGFYPGVYNLEWVGTIELDGSKEFTRSQC